MHFHLKNTKQTKISSEAWIVMSGKLKVTFYDHDKSKVYEDVLNKGIYLFYFKEVIHLNP